MEIIFYFIIYKKYKKQSVIFTKKNIKINQLYLQQKNIKNNQLYLQII